ncbi:MAG: universal stress protein [Deltaproteobacteria bacterium]|nr:universal stress protein [Deltaproteobacteria bacterium]
MFDKILFATCARDACDAAARTAFDIAQRYNAHIYVFHVFGVPTHGYSQVVIDLITGDELILDENYVDFVKEETSDYCNQVLKNTKEYSFEVTIGFPHREILRFARHIDPDLIIMGGSTGDPDISFYKKTMTGSTYQRVAKAARCPVLVVSRSSASVGGQFSNVVFAADFSMADDAAFAFAFQLVQEQELDCEFHLFHVLDIRGIRTNKFDTPEYIEGKFRKATQQIRSKYVSRMEEFKPYSVKVWKGLPSVEIVKYAAEKHADLIVLAYHAKKREIGGAPHANILEQVIGRADCPVVSVNQYAGK